MNTHQAFLYAQQHHAEVAQAVAILFGFLASHATALLTHVNASSKVKATVALCMSTLAGVIASIAWAPGQPWYDWVKTILFAVAASHATWALKDITGVAITEQVAGPIGAPAAPTDPTTPPSTTDVPDPAP
jgi:hypothetical protein